MSLVPTLCRRRSIQPNREIRYAGIGVGVSVGVAVAVFVVVGVMVGVAVDVAVDVAVGGTGVTVGGTGVDVDEGIGETSATDGRVLASTSGVSQSSGIPARPTAPAVATRALIVSLREISFIFFTFLQR